MPTSRKPQANKGEPGLRVPWKRIVIAAAVTMSLAAAAGCYSVARITEKLRPELALTLMPSLAPALATQADRLIVEGARGPRPADQMAEARVLAQRALRSSALSAESLRTIAVSQGQQVQGWQHVLETALRVSRRDVGTQFLSIETAVARNDVEGALRHYDQLLSFSPSAGATLYPIMLTASDDGSILRALRRTVSTDPPWLERMIRWSWENPAFAVRLARLIDAIPPSSDAMAPDFAHLLVDVLVTQGRLREAYLTYHSYRRAAAYAGHAWRPVRPFDWAGVDNVDTGSDATSGAEGTFAVFADRDASGEFLVRLHRLQAGTYQFSFRLHSLEGAGASLQTQISCAGGAASANLSSRYVAATRAGVAIMTFTVPPQQCPFQWIRLYIRAGNVSFTARIDGLSLRRMN